MASHRVRDPTEEEPNVETTVSYNHLLCCVLVVTQTNPVLCGREVYKKCSSTKRWGSLGTMSEAGMLSMEISLSLLKLHICGFTSEDFVEVLTTSLL